MADYLSYDNYLRYTVPLQSVGGGGDAGEVRDPNFRPLSKEEWDALPSEEKYVLLRDPPTASGRASDFKPFADEDDAQRFQAKFGETPWKADQSGRPEDKKIIWGYGQPTLEQLGVQVNHTYGRDPKEWMIDPSRIMYDEDGRWYVESDNIKGDWLANEQHITDERSDARAIRGVGTIAALAGGAYALSGGVGAASGTGAVSTGGIGYEVGTGVGAYTGGAGATGVAGAAGAATTPGSGIATQAPAPVSSAAPAVPGAGGAPVVNSVPPVAGTGPGAAAGGAGGSSGGIINGVRNAWNGVTGWYDGLSPASRYIVNSGVSQGVNALTGANAQREAQQAADEAERRAEEDRIRRGRVPVFKPGTFTPKPTGIINGARKPGG